MLANNKTIIKVNKNKFYKKLIVYICTSKQQILTNYITIFLL